MPTNFFLLSLFFFYQIIYQLPNTYLHAMLLYFLNKNLFPSFTFLIVFFKTNKTTTNIYLKIFCLLVPFCFLLISFFIFFIFYFFLLFSNFKIILVTALCIFSFLRFYSSSLRGILNIVLPALLSKKKIVAALQREEGCEKI